MSQRTLRNSVLVLTFYCTLHCNTPEIYQVPNLHLNKKVLLGEHKRHTDRGVKNTPSIVLYRRVPLLVPPVQTWSGNTPPPSGPGWTRLDEGTPHPRLDGVPPPPIQGCRYPPLLVWTWSGYRPPRCGQTDNIISRLVLRTWAVNMIEEILKNQAAMNMTC